jgi:hypothetical protein
MKERLCKPNWIETYLEYTDNQESPKSFHQWVAVAIIGAILKRRVWIPRVKYTIYPNLYVILIAGSAKCRKSIALSIGVKLMRAMKQPPSILAQKITTEALIQTLEEGKETHGSCCGLAVASELSVFLGVDSMKSGLLAALTDLYDGHIDWHYRTRSRGKEELKEVTLSMIAASTKDWLRNALPKSAIGGGFTSRVVFVAENHPKKLILFSQENPDIETLMKNKLLHDLEEIAKLEGQVQFTKGAREVALEWYKQESFNVHGEKVDGYYGRKHDTMFKVATILSVAEGSTLVVDERHIKEALKMLDKTEEGLAEVLDSVASSEEGGETERLLIMINRLGKVKHSELLRRSWRTASSANFSEMIKTLVESGEIDMFTDHKNARWYKRKDT